VTNDVYWDCDCEKAYIRPKSEGYCPFCEAIYDPDVHPDSREIEVAAMRQAK
jgi:hypothetical protein